MKKQTKHRRIFVFLICIVFAIVLSGYTVIAGVGVIMDNRLKSGGDVFWTEGVKDFDIFENLRPSLGGEALIQPGSEGTYSFTVENRGNAPMTVYFRLFDENTYEIPMVYRLKTSDQYLFGNETTWEDRENLDQYEVKDTLPEHTQREYKLDWSWSDNQGAESDARDTWIGNQAAEGKEVTYTLHMSLRAEADIEDPEKPVDPEEPDKPTDPEKPIDPENPNDPEEPTEPEHPENPEEPTEPENTNDPEEPTEPEHSEKPEAPGNPEEPIHPEKPGELSTPKDPADSLESIESADPEKPDTKEEGKTETPNQTMDRNETGNSLNQGKPTESGNSEASKKSAESKEMEENNAGDEEEASEAMKQVVVEEPKGKISVKTLVYTGTTAAVLSGFFLLIFLWKKKKEEEDEEEL